MSDTEIKERRKTSNRALDIFVVIFCLSGAVASLYYFYQDIYATFRSFSITPAGTVTVKYNTVQRRLSDRAVWDRLFEQSPVYSGDLVRIAQLSGATLNIDDNSIELGENTLIRIQKDQGPLQIEFSYGNISVTSKKDKGAVLLSIGNQVVQVQPGAEVNALSGNDGLVLRVTDGAAQVIKGGQITDVPSGGIIVQDAQGNEVRRPMAAVVHPKPNAVLLKTEASPLNVEFKWARINMRAADVIRLEIAEDKNFKRIIQTLGNLDSSATASLNAGLWYWRLLHENDILAEGRMSVISAVAPALLAPSASGPAQIPVKYLGQEVQFRWAEVPDAAYYLLNVSKSPEFVAPEINVQVQTTSYVNSDIDVGTWYWRVQPVFSNVSEGSAQFSRVSSFQVQSASSKVATTASATSPATAESTSTPFPLLNENTSDIIAQSEIVQEQLASAEANAVVSAEANAGTVVNTAVAEEKALEDTFTALLEETRQIWQVQEGRRVQEERRAQQELRAQQEQRAQQERRAQEQRAQEQRAQEQRAQQELRTQLAQQERTQTRQSSQTQTRQTAQTASAEQTQRQTRQESQTQQNQQPLQLRLISPENNVVISGLTAIRQPTVFRWATDEDLEFSRFVLSRRANPVSGRPEIDIQNPGRVVQIPDLAEGVWYWTVEARTKDGRPVVATSPRQIRVQPIPLLLAPRNMLPESGFVIGADELRQKKSIVFSWASVDGANAYILSILKDGFPRKRQLLQTDPIKDLTYSFNDYSLFDDSGTYYWQVEAVSSRDGMLEQRGTPGENKFTLDVPRPGRVKTQKTGVLYGR